MPLHPLSSEAQSSEPGISPPAESGEPAGSETHDRSLMLLQRRIRICSRVCRSILVGFGAVAAIVQVVKMLPTPLDQGWDLTTSNFIALGVGLMLLALGRSSWIPRGIRASLGNDRRRAQALLFALPFGFSLAIALLKILLDNGRSYDNLMREGSFFEYATVLAYLLACGFAVPVGHYFRKRSQKLLAGLYYLFAACCFFVGMEEISWGQTLFSWDSNAFFDQNNNQQETNLHNMHWFGNSLSEGLILVTLIGLIAAIAGMVYHRRRASEIPPIFTQADVQSPNLDRAVTNNAIAATGGASLSKFFFPSWYTLGYFAITLVVYIIVIYFRDDVGFIISSDQEFVELLLAMAFLLVSLSGYFRQGLLRQGRKSVSETPESETLA